MYPDVEDEATHTLHHFFLLFYKWNTNLHMFSLGVKNKIVSQCSTSVSTLD